MSSSSPGTNKEQRQRNKPIPKQALQFHKILFEVDGGRNEADHCHPAICNVEDQPVDLVYW